MLNRRLNLAMVLVIILTTGVLHADVTALCQRFDAAMEMQDVKGARTIIESAMQEDPASCQVMYRQARLLVILGDMESAEERRTASYAQAVDLSTKALQRNPSCMGAYIYRAAANGKIALTKGIFSVGGVVTSVRDDATVAIRLHNDTPQRLAAAYYILGRTHLNVQRKPKFLRLPLGLGWGNYDEAIMYLQKARELRRDFIMFELEYAKCLYEGGRENEALELVRRIPSMANKEPGDQQRRDEAVALMREWE